MFIVAGRYFSPWLGPDSIACFGRVSHDEKQDLDSEGIDGCLWDMIYQTINGTTGQVVYI